MPPPSEIFLEHLPLVERVIRSVCRGKMDRSQIEEFTAHVHLRLVEHDYAIIRKFGGRSSFGTYLTTVVQRLLNDHRNHEWGKWRASAEAKRLGPLAVELERLTVREALSIDEAFVELSRDHLGTTKERLQALAARLPKRHHRKMVRLEESPEVRVAAIGSETIGDEQMGKLISSVVQEFIGRLPQDDQLLFQLRFESEMPVPQIAKSLKLDAQSLYRRLRVHCTALREDLERAGISAADVARLIGSDDAVLDFQFKTRVARPSNDEDRGAPPEEEP